MDQEEQKGLGRTPKRHSRNISLNKVTLPREAAEDDPLAIPPPPPSKEPPKPPPREASESRPPRIPSRPPIAFGHLLRPENYHSLQYIDIPPPFRTLTIEPSPPLPELLRVGHFRAAAIKAVESLTGNPPPSTTELFNLLYIRLACLTLINQIPLAAQESRILQDLTSINFINSETKENVLPWELRVLATRLQGISFGDLRKAVMGYYDLARDARACVFSAKTSEEKDLWRTRLFDLGLRVANALVEMEDVAAAARHLSTLDSDAAPQSERDLMHSRLALLYLRIGNLAAARNYIVGQEGQDVGRHADVLRPLLSIAEGNYGSAATQLRASREAVANAKDVDPLVTSNLAVTLLYSGSMKTTRALFEEMLGQGMAFPNLLFNLSTVYELVTDRSRALKVDLAERMAERPGDETGWERSMLDFKL